MFLAQTNGLPLPPGYKPRPADLWIGFVIAVLLFVFLVLDVYMAALSKQEKKRSDLEENRRD